MNQGREAKTKSVVKRNIICLLIGFAPVFVYGNDEPDLKKEQRFFEIYSQFNSEPTSDEGWGAVVEGKSNAYVVQKGDTLWAVSQTLFGDPQFWPKIWSLNNEGIQNPHEILPDQTIQFVAGTMGEPPSVELGQAGTGENSDQAATEAPVEALAAGGEAAPPENPLANIEMPAPSKEFVPLSGIPGSVPNWKFRKDRRNEMVMEVEKINRDFGSPDEVLPYFIQNQETKGLGKVAETEMGLSSAGDFQYIYVSLPGGLTEKKLLVVKDIGEVEDPVTSKDGTIVQVQGEIEVLDLVNRDKQLYRAIVHQVYSAVEVGSLLVAGESPKYNSRQEGEKSVAAARVIGGQYNKNRRIFGTSNLIFLSGKGLTLGQSYPLMKIQTARVTDTKATESPRPIGLAKVVHVSEEFATAVVLSATEDIHVGDITDPQTNIKE